MLVCHNQIPIYPMFYLLKRDYRVSGSGLRVFGLGGQDGPLLHVILNLKVNHDMSVVCSCCSFLSAGLPSRSQFFAGSVWGVIDGPCGSQSTNCT